jgi:nicotinamide-nucleotide amidase
MPSKSLSNLKFEISNFKYLWLEFRLPRFAGAPKVQTSFLSQAAPARHTPFIVKVEIINTGTELTLGARLNTHQQWLCRELSALGYQVCRQITVPDSPPELEETFREVLSRADLSIITGGLGPTSDDLTRDLIAHLLECPLREDSAVLQYLENFFAARHRPIPPLSRVQALVPKGALVLLNSTGIAPGLLLQIRPGQLGRTQEGLVFLLPGPPRELYPMFHESVIPLLRKYCPPSAPLSCRTYLTTGLGESFVQDKIAKPLQAHVQAGLQIGYCARMGEVEVRLAAAGPEAEPTISAAERILLNLLGEDIFSIGHETLESVVVTLLKQKRRTLAVAESCTGGYLAHRITNVPGASEVFLSGLVTYSNQAKQNFLHIPAELLEEHGAVSEPVARGMAEGTRKVTGADLALSVTGIAGPAGGSATKPVGTVYIGLAAPEKTTVLHLINPYDRETFKQITTQQALNLLRKSLLALP